jgi:hypothetical protein
MSIEQFVMRRSQEVREGVRECYAALSTTIKMDHGESGLQSTELRL